MWSVHKFFTFVVPSPVPATWILGTVCMGKQICVKIIVFAWKSVGQVEDNVSLITGLLCLIGEFPQK